MQRKFFSKKSRLFYLVILAVSLSLEILFRTFPSFAEFYTVKVLPIVRVIYLPSKIFPFALSESLFLIFALLLLFLVGCLFALPFKRSLLVQVKLISSLLLKTVAVLVFLFSLTFSSSYHRVSIADSLSLERADITEEELYSATEAALEKLWEVSRELEYAPESMSSSGMDFKTLSKEIKNEVNNACKRYPFLIKGYVEAKPFALSEPLTYTYIAGIYTYFTGEPCVNTNYAEYTLPYTIAHEYSHQCGIGAEDEADFTAFLILHDAALPYLKYSAWAEAFSVLSSKLYEVSPDRYKSLARALPSIAINDYAISSRAFQRYTHSPANEIASTVNDAYLKANGVEEGVVSYSESVILLISFINSL